MVAKSQARRQSRGGADMARRSAALAALTLAGPLAGLLAAGSCVPPPGTAAAATAPRVDLAQGWSQRQRDDWYEGAQGSRLVPYAWAKALEVAGGTDRFFSLGRIVAYRYLPPEPTSRTGLPVGFALDDSSDARLAHTNLRWFAGQGSREKCWE